MRFKQHQQILMQQQKQFQLQQKQKQTTNTTNIMTLSKQNFQKPHQRKAYVGVQQQQLPTIPHSRYYHYYNSYYL